MVSQDVGEVTKPEYHLSLETNNNKKTWSWNNKEQKEAEIWQPRGVGLLKDRCRQQHNCQGNETSPQQWGERAKSAMPVLIKEPQEDAQLVSSWRYTLTPSRYRRQKVFKGRFPQSQSTGFPSIIN